MCLQLAHKPEHAIIDLLSKVAIAGSGYVEPTKNQPQASSRNDGEKSIPPG
jgi:hypothetical protein